MELSLLKGTKDYLPQEQILRQRVLDVLRRTFESYGYSPLETPVLNNFDLLASKYAGGAEILKETYGLTDQGKRQLGLRYDLTVPFARIIGFYEGLHHQIQLPLKRYEIGKVFRDGPVRSGRVREFTQCDVDIVGTNDMSAEAELFAMAGEVFEQLDLPVVIRFNHRKVLSAALEHCGVPAGQIPSAILSIDKLEKIGWKGVCKELQEKSIGPETLSRLDDLFHITGSTEEVLDALERQLPEEQAKQGIDELRRLLELLPATGFSGRLRLVPSLARGLEIYTGTVFECFLVDQQGIASSLAAGGRYDEIIGRFLEAEDAQHHEGETSAIVHKQPQTGAQCLLEHPLRRERGRSAETSGCWLVNHAGAEWPSQTPPIHRLPVDHVGHGQSRRIHDDDKTAYARA